MSDLFLVGKFDQPLSKKHDIQEILDRIDAYFNYDMIEDAVKWAEMSGIVLAKVLWKGYEQWLEDEDQEPANSWKVEKGYREFIYTNYGISDTTCSRYVRVWQMFEQKVPKEIKNQLLEKNMIMLQRPAVAISNGEIDPSEEEWQKIARTPDDDSMLELMREMKGKESRKGTLFIKIDDQGDLYVVAEERVEWIGHLDMESSIEIVQKAINRIQNRTGIVSL